MQNLYIYALLGGYMCKMYLDYRRAGRVRPSIVAGSLLCIACGAMVLMLYAGKVDPATVIESNPLMFFSLVAGFCVGNTLITVTNIFDHDFTRKYGPIRKTLFWMRNVSGLATSSLLCLIMLAVIVTISVTSKVSASEKEFLAKEKEMEQQLTVDGVEDAQTQSSIRTAHKLAAHKIRTHKHHKR
ncbi:MAG TPA: hypothetical protein V6C72_09505 [Chroococcales cyanobacterium]